MAGDNPLKWMGVEGKNRDPPTQGKLCLSYHSERGIYRKGRREHETRCLEAPISPSPSEAGHNPLQQSPGFREAQC